MDYTQRLPLSVADLFVVLIEYQIWVEFDQAVQLALQVELVPAVVLHSLLRHTHLERHPEVAAQLTSLYLLVW